MNAFPPRKARPVAVALHNNPLSREFSDKRNAVPAGSGVFVAWHGVCSWNDIMLLEFLTVPVIGAVIGYATNYVAIKMLFRPHTAKFVCGVKVPFTPGIIPKEKSRLAEAVGEIISKNLMNREVLENHLLSPEMISKVRTSVKDFIRRQQAYGESLHDFLRRYLTETEIDHIAKGIDKSLNGQLRSRFGNPELGNRIARKVVAGVADKMRKVDPSSLMPAASSTLFLLGKGLYSILDAFLNAIREPAEKLLADNINRMIRDDGPQMVSSIIREETSSLLATPVRTLLADKDEQLRQVPDVAENIYRVIISEHLPRILQTIDIAGIVSSRVNEMDMPETEKLVLQVVSKELRAIEWFGAGLGFIMGAVSAAVACALA